MRHVPAIPIQGGREDEAGPRSRPSTLRRTIRRLPVIGGGDEEGDDRVLAGEWFKRMSNGLLGLLIPLLAWQVVGAPRWVAWAILGVVCVAGVLGFVGEALRQMKR